jgi:alkyldihydroxyacetonephosphate synthase
MKKNIWPRVSGGMDINQIIIGSEGNFGIITEAVFKVHMIPEVMDFSSFLFYNFEDGVKFMKEVG